MDAIDPDGLAAFIRKVNGNNKMGAGELGERIADEFFSPAQDPRDARIAELEAEVARLRDGANDALAAYRRGLTPETILEELLAPYKEDQNGE